MPFEFPPELKKADFLYQEGYQEVVREVSADLSRKWTINLLKDGCCSVKEIAQLVEVSEEYVENLKASLEIEVQS